MPAIISHRHQKFLWGLDGGAMLQEAKGLSDDDPPVEIPIIDFYREKWGQDGTLYITDTARQGGEVKVKLLPTSETVKEWMNIITRIMEDGFRPIFTAVYGDEELDYQCDMWGGVLKMAPPNVVPGVTVEFTFLFEQLIPRFTNAKFVSLGVQRQDPLAAL